MTILSHNNEFVIIDDIPVRKKDVLISYVDIDRIQFSNVATEDKLMRSELYSAISVDGVFYDKKDDLAVVLADLFTTNGDISFAGIELIKGLKGDKGDTGDAGPQGIQGIQGLKGDVGDQGIQGESGPQGIQGEVGPQGLKGDQGLPGTNGTLISSGTENPTGGADGDIYLQYIL